MSTFIVVLVLASVSVLAWWMSHRRSSSKLSARDVIAEMQLRASQAVEEASSKHHVKLDFTPESVERVESILADLHDTHRRSSIDDQKLVKEALKWGGYIGEAIKRQRTSEWAVDSAVGGPGSFPIVYADEDESFPVRWCYKRIVNGAEDNVWHKFEILVLNRDDLSINPRAAQTPDAAIPPLDR